MNRRMEDIETIGICPKTDKTVKIVKISDSISSFYMIVRNDGKFLDSYNHMWLIGWSFFNTCAIAKSAFRSYSAKFSKKPWLKEGF